MTYMSMLAAAVLTLPSGVLADERLQAALAVVEPPNGPEIDRIVDTVATDVIKAKYLRARLQRLYRSPECRRRAAEVYARHLSAAERRHLAEAFNHPVFCKYRALAPVLMVELAEIERDLVRTLDGPTREATR